MHESGTIYRALHKGWLDAMNGILRPTVSLYINDSGPLPRPLCSPSIGHEPPDFCPIAVILTRGLKSIKFPSP